MPRVPRIAPGGVIFHCLNRGNDRRDLFDDDDDFAVQNDRHFLTVARYVERNALRARMVRRAQDWRWSSLWRRQSGSPEQRGLLSEWPVPRPKDWTTLVNRAQSDKEEAELSECIRRGRPFGDSPWQTASAKQMNLQATFRERGRPRKEKTAKKK